MIRVVLVLALVLALAACGGPDDPPPDVCAQTCAVLSEEWRTEVVGGTCGTFPNGEPRCVCLTANHPAAADPCAWARDL